MKAVSLWQPWASLIVWDLKRVETRGWYTGHRGPILIHAAKRWDGATGNLCLSPAFTWALHRMGLAPNPRPHHEQRPGGLPFGCIVGRVDVVECVPTSAVEIVTESSELGYRRESGEREVWITSAEAAYGDFGPQRWAWLLANPVRFETPIPWTGRQQLFDVPVTAEGMPDPAAGGTPRPLRPTYAPGRSLYK